MINKEEVAKHYNDLDSIWNQEDGWHWYVYLKIKDFIKNNAVINKNSKILNAGSGGTTYNISDKNTIHLDIAEKKISKYSNYIVGSVDKIPIENEKFDIILCVGSVINYADPMATIKEFSRLSKKDTCLILEFENSKTLELLFSKNYNKKVVLIDTFYNKKKEKIWFFSEDYILEILNEYSFSLQSFERFHILSPFIYLIFKNENFAAKFSFMDKILKCLPLIRKNSSNVILMAKKL